jgi:hypothetical protein
LRIWNVGRLTGQSVWKTNRLSTYPARNALKG